MASPRLPLYRMSCRLQSLLLLRLLYPQQLPSARVIPEATKARSRWVKVE
jgi:hypothetical protein